MGRFDTVLGAEVAAQLGYRLGDRIVVAHGSGEVSFSLHEAHPFTVTGILARTGTPVDRTVHVTLAGMDAMHEDNATGPAADPLGAAMVRRGPQRQPGRETRMLMQPSVLAAKSTRKTSTRPSLHSWSG